MEIDRTKVVGPANFSPGMGRSGPNLVPMTTHNWTAVRHKRVCPTAFCEAAKYMKL